MLKECAEHGYFRGEKCPFCGAEGRFLMNDQEIAWFGRTLTGILRHFPEEFGLEMDMNGWVDVKDIVRSIRRRNQRARWLKTEHVIALAKTDEKGRYQLMNGKIRATYGHSKEVVLDLPTDNIPATLYYPSSREEAAILVETGIRHSDRAKVHLSDTKISAVEAGKHRMNEPVILKIDAAGAIRHGVVIQRAGKHVYITDFIPAEYIEPIHEHSVVTDEEENGSENHI